MLLSFRTSFNKASYCLFLSYLVVWSGKLYLRTKWTRWRLYPSVNNCPPEWLESLAWTPAPWLYKEQILILWDREKSNQSFSPINNKEIGQCFIFKANPDWCLWRRHDRRICWRFEQWIDTTKLFLARDFNITL